MEEKVVVDFPACQYVMGDGVKGNAGNSSVPERAGRGSKR
jgi:hypothetical protein